jgi:hypothetical protein
MFIQKVHVKLLNYLATFSVSLLLLMGSAFGQTPGTGAISGIVYDPAGRVVQNAGILVVNEATHASRKVVTTVRAFIACSCCSRETTRSW